MGGSDNGPSEQWLPRETIEGLDERFSVRRATIEDLDDVLTVVLGGLSEDPKFDFRMPYRDQYPEDNRKWLRQEYEEYLEDTKKYALIVVTASDFNDKPIAVSIWDIAMAAPHLGGGMCGFPQQMIS